MNGDPRPPILVVEDENVVAMDLMSSLKKLDYPVAGVAASGEEAIALAQSTGPGLVLMDIHLRGNMDGIRAAQHIQDKLFVPVVYLTAYSDQATLDRARLSHPYGYLLKPFEDREIEVAIQIALFRHKLESALRDSERRLDAIVTSIGDAVIATDTERRITLLNRSAEALLGWKSERARGRPLSDVLKVSKQADDCYMLERARGGIPVELFESPVLDATDRINGHVIVARDISERLRAQRAHEREVWERARRAALEREHERARLKDEVSLILADLSQPLGLSINLRKVCNLLVPGQADWCVLLVDDQSDGLWIAVHRELQELAWAEAVQRLWQARRDAPRGPYAVLRTGQAELLENVGDPALLDVAKDPEQVLALRQLGVASYLCVPLRARQHVLGVLSFASTDANHRYDASDLTFAQELADRCAIALENARLYREAEESRARAEALYEAEQRARAEAETLFRIAEAMGETQLDLEILVQRVTDEATALVEAQFGAFFYNVTNEKGDAYLLYTLSGAPKQAFERLGLPRNTPIFGPTFAGEAVVRIDDVHKDPRYGRMGPHFGMPAGHLPVTSYLAVPVVSRTGTVIGGLFFGHPEPARFNEQHERVAKALAAHAAVAMDNARLFGAARDGEERLTRLVKELERTVHFSEMFVGILGHDLRNPLGSITTGAHLLLGRTESEPIQTPLRRILRSAGRMSRMIDQILDFTHVRLGKGIPLRRKQTDLTEICRAVLEELKQEGKDDAPLTLELAGDAGGVWDEDRLMQLVSNLAGNAIQHRTPGTPVSVRIDAIRPDRVILEVRNQGVIPPDVVPILFEPLRSGMYTKRQGASGLGLGLYISQEVAMAHGGSIRVESDPSRGTRFAVELPRAIPVESERVFLPKGEAT